MIQILLVLNSGVPTDAVRYYDDGVESDEGVKYYDDGVESTGFVVYVDV